MIKYSRERIPIWHADNLKSPLETEEIKSDVREKIEKYYGPDFLNDIHVHLIPFTKIDQNLSDPIFNFKKLPERLNQLGAEKVESYLSAFRRNLNLDIKPSKYLNTFSKTNLLASIHFLNKKGIKPEDIEKSVPQLSKLFTNFSSHVAHYLRRNRPEEFAETMKKYKKSFEENKARNFEALTSKLGVNIQQSLKGEGNWEKPIYLDKMADLLDLSEENISQKKIDEFERKYGTEATKLLKEVDPISFLLYLSKGTDFATRDNTGFSPNAFITLNPQVHTPTVFVSHAGRCRFAPWENALDNAYFFGNIDQPRSELPRELIEDSEKGNELINAVRDRGYIASKDSPYVVGFNYARVLLLPKKELEQEIKVDSVLKSEYGEMVEVASDELFYNLLDSFKSSVWCFNLLKNKETKLALNRLKKVRSAEPALHEDNPFQNYRLFKLKQDINSPKPGTNITTWDFYVDYCGNVDEKKICEYSMLSKPHTLEESGMNSIGIGYRFFDIKNNQGDAIGVKVTETLWKDFIPASSHNLGIYQIIKLNNELKDHTLAANLLRRIKEGGVKL